jgi:hypothetical protein
MVWQDLPSINWPGAALSFGLACVVLFRMRIGELLGRLKSVRIGGNSIDVGSTPNPQEAALAGPKKSESQRAEEILHGFADAVILEHEKRIADDLEQQGIVQGEKRDQLLRRLLAAAVMSIEFERLYRAVYGSQILALQKLNERAPIGLPLDQLRLFYNLGRDSFPAVYASYNLEEWLAFLESFGLINRSTGNIQLSVRGRSFLVYLTNQGYPLEKLG